MTTPSQVPKVVVTDVNGNPVSVSGGALSTTGGGGGATTQVTGALTDKSGTIATGGTAQTPAASNTSRKYILIRNPMSGPGPLWFSLVGTATQASPSFRLDPGDQVSFSGPFIPTNALSVVSATTGAAFTCWEG